MKELYKEIEEKITSCEQEYEEHKHDSYLSHVLNSELESLQHFYTCVKEKDASEIEELIAKWKKGLIETEEDMDREAECPSFSWYGDHYNYLVLEGHRDAYRSMIGILERYCEKR